MAWIHHANTPSGEDGLVYEMLNETVVESI